MATFSLRNFILIGSGGIAAQSAALYFLGQPAICACGYVKLWEGSVLSAGNSQHVFDWYSFTHVIHGTLFYLLTWLLLPRYPMGGRLLVAIGIEAGWEIVENTPLVIRLYRAQALALGYSGDSILNSISDTFMMALGFILSWRLPLWGVVALAVAMEVALAALIRDNLTLNLLNLIHPSTSSGAGRPTAHRRSRICSRLRAKLTLAILYESRPARPTAQTAKLLDLSPS